MCYCTFQSRPSLYSRCSADWACAVPFMWFTVHNNSQSHISVIVRVLKPLYTCINMLMHEPSLQQYSAILWIQWCPHEQMHRRAAHNWHSASTSPSKHYCKRYPRDMSTKWMLSVSKAENNESCWLCYFSWLSSTPARIKTTFIQSVWIYDSNKKLQNIQNVFIGILMACEMHR